MLDTVNQITRQRDLLAEALARLLVSMGLVREDAAAHMSGPELLLAADTAIEHMDEQKRQGFMQIETAGPQ